MIVALAPAASDPEAGEMVRPAGAAMVKLTGPPLAVSPNVPTPWPLTATSTSLLTDTVTVPWTTDGEDEDVAEDAAAGELRAGGGEPGAEAAAPGAAARRPDRRARAQSRRGRAGRPGRRPARPGRRGTERPGRSPSPRGPRCRELRPPGTAARRRR